METLREYGLELVGEWVLSVHKSTKHLSNMKGINFIIPKELSNERNIIYSFVIDSSIVYIGETTAGMGSRFQGYRYGNPLESDTDNRVKVSITKALEGNKTVEIWYSKPVSKYELMNGEILEIPASKPIEEHLIEIFKPILNVKNLNAKGN